MTGCICYTRTLLQAWKRRQLFYLKHRIQHKVSRKMKQRSVFQMKQQIKVTGKFHNLMEVNDLPDKEFKIMVTKMLTEFRRTMPEQSETFKEEIKHVFKVPNKS